MGHDLIIRGGSVIDGTGVPARTADVAITDGRVVEVGRVDGPADRTIDADGAIVAPGFVDIHTHYDGQATWDERLQPSSSHGVTTVVGGNCGVGFAPVRPADREQLIELMEGVEDLPGTVLHEGLSWEWESIADYLDALDRRRYDLDVAAQVCHGPVRLYVMGQRGADREPATADEIEAMGRLVADGIRAGALGFSTSRTLNHRTSRGQPTPTLTASRDELVGIARAVGTTGQGVLQVVSDFTDAETESDTFLEMMRASGRPLSFSLLQTAAGPGYRKRLELLEDARAEGLMMRAQVAPRPVGLLIGMQGTINPFVRTDAFAAVADRPLADQARHLSEPETRAQAIAEMRNHRMLDLHQVFELGDPPDYEPDADDSVAARAGRDGVDPLERYVDLLLGDEGRALLYLPFLNYFDGNLDAAAEMLAHPYTVPGLSDGGAHVGTICDASFPTSLLTHWGRDREQGTFDLPFLFQRQCRSTAEAVGLLDRGVLAPGYRADVNVIDLEHLTLTPPTIVRDLPAGGKRLTQGATGYLHTVVAGEETYTGGAPTGALPGRFVRGPRADAATEVRR